MNHGDTASTAKFEREMTMDCFRRVAVPAVVKKAFIEFPSTYARVHR